MSQQGAEELVQGAVEQESTRDMRPETAWGVVEIKTDQYRAFELDGDMVYIFDSSGKEVLEEIPFEHFRVCYEWGDIHKPEWAKEEV